MKYFLLLLFPLTALASLKPDFSGNIEAQGRHALNNEQAREDLLQRWKEENFYLLYGNLNGKINFTEESSLEANWFLRQSYSKLYRDNYFATQIYNFPNRLVARDIFKLQYRNQENNYQTDSVLNKFFYERQMGAHKLTLGRMYINYGLGEIFNPINPFNQPTGLTSISQVAQGNDGVGFSYNMSDRHTLNLYALGDKAIKGYDGEIDYTFWAQGEYQATEKLQLDYVFGKDQLRYKVGSQGSYRFQDALAFAQVLYQTEYIDNDLPSDNLWDALLGYDEQLTSKWHIRLEGGYQKRSRNTLTLNFGDRFLPTEYFAALANVVEVHPLVKVSGTVINDIKSGFTYLIAKSTFDLGHNSEADIFGYAPVGKGGQADSPAQKLVTTDIGMALRTFF
jgi:hypothetical protein